MVAAPPSPCWQRYRRSDGRSDPRSNRPSHRPNPVALIAAVLWYLSSIVAASASRFWQHCRARYRRSDECSDRRSDECSDRRSDRRSHRPNALALIAAVLWCLSSMVAAAGDRTVLVFGDSLSAGYGMDRGQSWPTVLQQRLGSGYPDWTVVNASSSGETTNGGRVRIDGLLAEYRPAIVIVELGGNDGLSGLPPQRIYANLRQIAGNVLASGATCIIAGMHIPPNYGDRYTAEFHALFQRLATELDLPLVPFLLDGIATRADLMQADGIHPTVAAQPLIIDNLWPVLAPLLAQPAVAVPD